MYEKHAREDLHLVAGPRNLFLEPYHGLEVRTDTPRNEVEGRRKEAFAGRFFSYVRVTQKGSYSLRL
jgi:hypothetical protein